jgi:hypothetical protein
MVAMQMIARRAGRCLNCQFGILPGQKIDWTKGVGAKHIACPSGQVKMQTGDRQVHWRRLDNEPGKPWVIRVADPTGGCHALTGQEVVLTRGKKAGQPVLLGERLDGSTQRDSTYAPAVENATTDPLPDADAVPAGRYALEEDGDRFLLVRVWRKGTLVNVYDVRTREKVADMRSVMERIVEAGAGFSAILYGKVTCQCSRCNAKLDVRLSAELGIGPDCIKHWYGDADRKTMMRRARKAIRDRGQEPNERISITADEVAA